MKDLMAVNLMEMTLADRIIFAKECNIATDYIKLSTDDVFNMIESQWNETERLFNIALNTFDVGDPFILNFKEFSCAYKKMGMHNGKTFCECSVNDELDDVDFIDTVYFIVEKTFKVNNILFQSIKESYTGSVILWQPELQNISFGRKSASLDGVRYYSEYYGLGSDNVFIQLPKECENQW